MNNRSKSSQSWLQEHFKDPFVKASKAAGYRSRAAFKLLELQQKEKLWKPGMTVVELGAAPGGWTQLLSQWVGSSGRVLAVDKLPLSTLPNVWFLQGDFTHSQVVEALREAVGTTRVDWVISDMAPNLSGIYEVDQAQSQTLAELAFEFAEQILSPKGGFLVKVFQGNSVSQWMKDLKQHFESVELRKPEASRARSAEVYLLAKRYKALTR